MQPVLAEMAWGAVPGGALAHLGAVSGTGEAAEGARVSPDLQHSSLWGEFRAQGTSSGLHPQIHGNIQCPAVAEPGLSRLPLESSLPIRIRFLCLVMRFLSSNQIKTF